MSSPGLHGFSAPYKSVIRPFAQVYLHTLPSFLRPSIVMGFSICWLRQFLATLGVQDLGGHGHFGTLA